MSPARIEEIKRRFGIIGHADLLNAAVQVASQVAPTDISVIIHGASGTGKESFSKIIHALSKRKHNTFIAVNCGAIPEGTIDSELFGHEKGAFTGAQEVRKGYFETANRGTIFLDEVGEMPLATQARLLRILECGEYMRVGSSRVQRTDVRILAATNVDLHVAIEEKKFREDLYYRLNTVPIHVPSLASRKKDIGILFESFVLDACERYHRLPLSVEPEALDLLSQTHFPGNIRQLKNLAEQVSLLEKQQKLSVEALRIYLPPTGAWLPAVSQDKATSSEKIAEKELLYKLLFEMRRDVQALKQLIYQLLQSNTDHATLLARHDTLFDEIEQNPKTAEGALSYTLPTEVEKRPTVPVVEKIEDIAHEHAEGSQKDLSLRIGEKDMIRLALDKHAFKRRDAAEELGISERTLYRKIKNYGITL